MLWWAVLRFDESITNGAVGIRPMSSNDTNRDPNDFDPFSDDEVRNYRPYRNVRPSGFLQKAGSTSTQQNGATTVRPSTGTPARKATHRTPTPTLTPPVRQTSVNDQQAIGSGVIRTSAAIPRSVTPQPAVTPTSTRKNSSSIVELSPTDYLSSARSASKNR